MDLPAAAPTLVVAQVESRALIGDGPRAGHPCAVVRLGGCNLACSWCDVPETWDGSRFPLQDLVERRIVRRVLEELLELAPPTVLITGGEPLLQQRSEGWYTLLVGLAERGVPSELHTNGTRVPNPTTLSGVSRFHVSPKLAHSGEPSWSRLIDEALTSWAELARAGRADFSFVVRDRTDVLTVHSLVGLHGIPPATVHISPQGRSAAEVSASLDLVAEAALSLGFAIAQRLLVRSGAAFATGAGARPGPVAGTLGR